MLFNSYIFLFAFLPITLAGFHVLSRLGRGSAAAWLILSSFVFYGWWNPQFLVLLAGSIGFNYATAELIGFTERRPAVQRAVLSLAIAANLTALIYYKYLASLIQVAIGLGLIHSTQSSIVLPLGISFFTFTQIGYLVDMQQGVIKDRGFLNYVLFVTFFPHLIAGPILNNREIMPQFGQSSTYRYSSENLAVGLSIFAIGLAKKCLLADPLSAAVGSGFGAAAHLPVLAAWNVALSYSLQLYFDFSGYSDMAIGLARMFNVRFPLNFNSPYKATSIIDHWQRWHMTLSRYLAVYVYNPLALAVTRWRAERGLGTSRESRARVGGFTAMVMFPTVFTMGLAGIWHGAGLQFLIFGVLHGIYLTINHVLRMIRPLSAGQQEAPVVNHCLKVLVTYLAVLLASIFFRAPSVGAALELIRGMIGFHGFDGLVVPAAILERLGFIGGALAKHGVMVGASIQDFTANVLHFGWIVCLYFVIWGMPNTQQIMRRFAPALGRVQPGPFERLVWQPSLGWAVATAIVASGGLLAISGTSEFLYFQF